jgi:hypothetical protein
VRRAGVRRAAAEIFRGLTRFEQAPLRDGQPLVGLALRGLQAPDRRARFFLPPIQGVALFFRLTLLARELLGFLREPRLLVGRVLQLGIVPDDRLVLLMMLGIQRGDGVGGVRHRAFEVRRLLRQPRQRLAVRPNASAQLLDLAFGFEDAA